MLNYIYSTEKISADILQQASESLMMLFTTKKKKQNFCICFSLRSTTTSVDAYQGKCIYLFVSSKVSVCFHFKCRVALP